MLLVLVAKALSHRMKRCPYLSTRLSAGYETSTLCDCSLPVFECYLFISFVSKEHTILSEFVKVGPDFEHSARFKIEDVVHFFTGLFFGEIIKPFGKRDRHIKCFFASCVSVHIAEAHKCLVDIVMRCPDLFSSGYPVKILFGDGCDPDSAILILAFF